MCGDNKTMFILNYVFLGKKRPIIANGLSVSSAHSKGSLNKTMMSLVSNAAK